MKYKWLPVFDVNNCSGCRACMPYCASGSLNIEDGVVSFKNPEACLSDERCVQECPVGGIHMEWLPLNSASHLGSWSDQKPQMQNCS
ncbi:MAG: hypothetical protein HQL14_05930 [Candidatus Omnitrophica bacterium]|nr:hypothetical protein [Candidatus Omnitrophota bacterium]